MKFEKPKPETIKINEKDCEYLYIPPATENHFTCLVIHGNGGGWDQGYDMVKPLLPSGTGILAVSRFGYLGSELPEDSTPNNQARVLKGLLEYLEIDKVIVFYGSAGSFPGMRFALSYPENTVALISLAGVAFSEDYEIQKGPPEILINDFVFGLFKDLFPGFFRSMFGITSEEWKAADEKNKEEYNGIITAMFPIAPRKKGMINDARVTVVDSVGNYDQYRVEDLECPVLILHSDTDPWNSGDEIKKMASRIKTADLLLVPGGGHVLLGYGEMMHDKVMSFFDQLNQSLQF